MSEESKRSFPKPLDLPGHIPFERDQRHKDLSSASKQGISIRLFIIGVEMAGYFYFHSSALLLDALSTLVDVSSTLFLLFCMRLAKKPPDEDHPFGHGRYEPIAGLQLGLLLAGLGGAMFIQQLLQMFNEPQDIAINSNAWLIPLGVVALLEISYQKLRRVALKQNSPALMADAYHYRVDALNSLLAAVALGMAAYFPGSSQIFDHIGAMVIAFLMIIMGSFAARSNLHQLMDRIPESSYFEKVRLAARRVKGVFDTEKIRIQHYGPDAHIDIDIEVDPEQSVRDAHEISQKVRREIQKDWPAVQDVTVHIEPYYPGDHI